MHLSKIYRALAAEWSDGREGPLMGGMSCIET